MPKLSQIDRAIQELERQREVINAALEVLVATRSAERKAIRKKGPVKVEERTAS